MTERAVIDSFHLVVPTKMECSIFFDGNDFEIELSNKEDAAILYTELVKMGHNLKMKYIGDSAYLL